MKQIAYKYIQITGGVLLLIGALVYVSHWWLAPYIYLTGAVMFGYVQVSTPYEGSNFVLRRLYRQQTVAAVLLVLTGVLMLCLHHNEWMVCLLVAAVFELYTAFRIPQEEKKE